MKNGKLLLDDPSTDLPEGEVVFLQQVEIEPGPEEDGFTADERAALNKELEASIAEADAGETVSFKETL